MVKKVLFFYKHCFAPDRQVKSQKSRLAAWNTIPREDALLTAQTISLGVGSLASGVSTGTGLAARLDGRLLLPDVGIGGRS